MQLESFFSSSHYGFGSTLGGNFFRINLWAKARDYVGLVGYLWLGGYTMPGSCGGNFH